MQEKYKNLMQQATEASKNAYAPYSNFKVGACVLFESGNTYVGCNVENSSYGLSLCAERNALSSAIASGESSKLVAVAIYSPNQANCLPCGACRQWIVEFSDSANVILQKEDKSLIIYKITELLPKAFIL